jgi:hypothetical protein
MAAPSVPSRRPDAVASECGEEGGVELIPEGEHITGL